MAEEDDFFDALIPYLEEQRIIPVVGPDLLMTGEGEAAVPFYRAVAKNVIDAYAAAKPVRDEPPFDPSTVSLSPGHELNDAVSAVMHLRRRDLYSTVARAINEVRDATGEAMLEPLRQLASIEAFKLFVTTTPDDLLERALNQVRHEGAARTRQILHVPNLPTGEFRDITETDLASSSFTAVLYLFGRARNAQLYAIHDEDVLEYVHNLQTRGSNVPERFLGKLRAHDLLLIGCRMSDWLTRFFLRLASQNRLGDDRRPKREFVIEESADPGDGLTVFLERFSRQTCVFRGNPQAFVAELSRRWRASHQTPAVQAGGAPPARPASAAAQDSIFLSYSRHDFAAAQQLCKDLQELRIEAVWFDHDRLQPGDEWSKAIASAIKRCYLFVPLISSHTEQRNEGYFREEWKQAVERDRQIEGRAFIVPVVIDADYSGNAADYRLVPQEFLAKQFGHAPHGKLNEALRDRLIALIRELRLLKAA